MAKKVPTVSVIERRLLQPFGSEAPTITLKDRTMIVRVVSAALRPDRLYQMQHYKGWTFVEPGDIDGDPTELGFQIENGRVVRGDRGQEVLMKMRKSDYRKIEQAKSRANVATMGSSKRTKEELANAAAGRFGEEAGQFVQDRIVGEVIDSRERVTDDV